MTVNNEVITKALTEAQSVDEMVAAFADQGIEITAQELEQLMKDVLAEESGEELSEGDLEGVSGGSAYSWAMNTARNIVVGAVKTVGQAFVNYVKRTFRLYFEWGNRACDSYNRWYNIDYVFALFKKE